MTGGFIAESSRSVNELQACLGRIASVRNGERDRCRRVIGAAGRVGKSNPIAAIGRATMVHDIIGITDSPGNHDGICKPGLVEATLMLSWVSWVSLSQILKYCFAKVPPFGMRWSGNHEYHRGMIR